jgi:hypothetical protein
MPGKAVGRVLTRHCHLADDIANKRNSASLLSRAPFDEWPAALFCVLVAEFEDGNGGS